MVFCCFGNSNEEAPYDMLAGVDEDAVAAMTKKHPAASASKVAKYAQKMPDGSGDNMARVALHAASKCAWDVMHAVIANGVSMASPDTSLDLELVPKWIESTLRRVDRDHFLANYMLAVAAYNHSVVAVRFILAKAESIGVTAAGRALLPAVFASRGNEDVALWMLANAGITDADLAVCVAASFNAMLVNTRTTKLAKALVERMRVAGASHGSLCAMFASLDGTLGLAGEDVESDASVAMAAKHPVADQAEVMAFASKHRMPLREDPAAVMLYAAACNQWSVVHALVLQGTDPFTTVRDIVNMTRLDNTMMIAENRRVLAANALVAWAILDGNITAVRFLVHHRAQLRLSDTVLRNAAALAIHAGDAQAGVWLLANMPINSEDRTDAFVEAVRAACQSNNGHAFVLLTSGEHRAETWRTVVSEAMDLGKTQLLEHMDIPDGIVHELCSAALIQKAKAFCLGEYIKLWDLVLASPTSTDAQTERVLAAQSAEDVVSSLKDASNDKVFTALVHAMRKGNKAVAEALLGVKDVLCGVSADDLVYCMRLAVDAGLAAKVFSALPTSDLQTHAHVVKAGAVHFLVYTSSDSKDAFASRVGDASAAVFLGAATPPGALPPAHVHRLCHQAIVLAAMCGSRHGLDHVLEAVRGISSLESHGPALIAAASAVQDTCGDYCTHKYGSLLDAAGKNTALFDNVASAALLSAARNNDIHCGFNIGMRLVAHHGLGYEAYIRVCEAGSASGNALFLEKAYDRFAVPKKELRLKWRMGKDTAELATKDIPTSLILEELARAAETPNTTANDSLSLAIRARTLSPPEAKAYEAYVARRQSYVRKTHAANEAAAIDKIARAFVAVDVEWAIARRKIPADRNCGVCKTALASHASHGGVVQVRSGCKCCVHRDCAIEHMAGSNLCPVCRNDLHDILSAVDV